jgi:RimJ/RimL family protein N-acetyltransferase
MVSEQFTDPFGGLLCPTVMDLRPITLEGAYVRLEPLTFQHLDGLVAAGREWELTPERMREGIEAALRDQAAGVAIPFATIHRASGQVVGSTRFRDAVPAHRRIEIGSTWIGAPWRRTALNTEAKYLMLEHAFERLGLVRVEFRTDAANEASRRALIRLGAVEEGTLRSYAMTASDEARDVVSYSIIAREWPDVRARVRELLARK